MIITEILLTLNLFLGGHEVYFNSQPPYPGALGLACAVAFQDVPGNAQARCPDGFEGIVVYPNALSDWQTAQNVFAHEGWHLAHTERGPVNDLFNERLAYGYACEAYPVDDPGVCPTWRAY